MKCSITAALAALAVLAVVPAASASTLSRDGGTLVLTAAPGEANAVVLDMTEDGEGSPRFTITDDAGITAFPSGCTTDEFDPQTHYCPLPAAFRVTLGDGNDRFHEFDPFGFPIDVAGEAGNDRLVGAAANGTLRGGAGDDDVQGGAGNDLVLGEDGNDVVSGDLYDARGTDVIDGGPGFDRIEQDWATSGETPPAAVAVSLDGVANDGRSGEGDNVLAVERVTNNASGSYSGSDVGEAWNVAADGAASVSGHGGADTLRTHRGSDTLDGGAGPDDIEAGYGDDTITGGPGADLIVADEKVTGCSAFGCEAQFGNDTVLVRDGEVDSVTCGAGADRVVADNNDVVAGDCETIERAGSGTANTPQTPAGAKKCVVPKLKGKTLARAKKALTKARCRLGRVKRANSRRKAGTVIKQSVRPGKRRPAGTKIGVTVARRR